MYEGEQEGAESVARHILGKAVREVFLRKYPAVHPPGRGRSAAGPEGARGRPGAGPEARSPGGEVESQTYAPIVHWFSGGQTLELSDESPFPEHVAALRSVAGLEACVRQRLPSASEGELAGHMELVLDGLHQCSMLAKEDADHGVGYRDMIGAMFRQMEEIE